MRLGQLTDEGELAQPPLTVGAVEEIAVQALVRLSCSGASPIVGYLLSPDRGSRVPLHIALVGDQGPTASTVLAQDADDRMLVLAGGRDSYAVAWRDRVSTRVVLLDGDLAVIRVLNIADVVDGRLSMEPRNLVWTGTVYALGVDGSAIVQIAEDGVVIDVVELPESFIAGLAPHGQRLGVMTAAQRQDGADFFVDFKFRWVTDVVIGGPAEWTVDGGFFHDFEPRAELALGPRGTSAFAWTDSRRGVKVVFGPMACW